MNVQETITAIQQANFKVLARAISFVENQVPGYEQLLQALGNYNTRVTGITGPPGAGKSSLTDALTGHWMGEGKKTGIICIDPSSPFNRGALLGDRIRMSEWFNNPNVYIRSLSSKGSLGGLHPKIIEITDLMKAGPFDNIIIETVGVGQSETEIASLADTTVVVMVPEAGDEIQTMKAGLMEIADIFVVNKADRPEADAMLKSLRLTLHTSAPNHNTPVLKTVATQKLGIADLAKAIEQHQSYSVNTHKKLTLLAEKAYRLIQKIRMSDIVKEELVSEIEKNYQSPHFNLYRFAGNYKK
ncbi:methylmalonyl Co-A mutase-associated GTPase MeaB [Foetidibacter luteolus]|uniref:methylmalonyl Co-A mutase-associated GTPase MeaB n=1 Tax=Foetidibacter luteolus TaxID=2608880 RepID=UPI00129B4D7D|nr:methylmalonyl Co-A mutase-associated GTPase MeaB [Foetidibacter luteolus]